MWLHPRQTGVFILKDSWRKQNGMLRMLTQKVYITSKSDLWYHFYIPNSYWSRLCNMASWFPHQTKDRSRTLVALNDSLWENFSLHFEETKLCTVSRCAGLRTDVWVPQPFPSIPLHGLCIVIFTLTLKKHSLFTWFLQQIRIKEDYDHNDTICKMRFQFHVVLCYFLVKRKLKGSKRCDYFHSNGSCESFNPLL